MTKYILILSFVLSKIVFSATYTTTAVAGTWDLGGSPGASDDIVINHDWSGYDAAQIANYAGTLTVNAGGHYRMAGSFTNFTGTVDIQSGGTFEVTGAVTVAAGSSTNVDGHWDVSGDLENNQTANWTGSGTLYVGGTFTDNGNVNTVTLPVDLIQFSAEKVGDHILLKWETASEINNDFFVVERSLDGFLFESIENVDGAGNSLVSLNYSFIDDQVPPNKNIYYRLKQVDFEGSADYSPIIAVNNPTRLQIIQSGSSANIEILSSEEGTLFIEAFNLKGQIIKTETHNVQKGNIVKFNLLKSGLFIIAVQLGNSSVSKKIIVQQ